MLSSQFALRPVSQAPLSCKICNAPAELYGVVDFSKSANPDVTTPLAGVPVYYRRCAACGFLFTDAFDDWDHDQFKTHIYNEGYRAFDPEYEFKRPNTNANMIVQLFEARKSKVRLLDFGGGNDALCRVLRAAGFPVAITYDPMVPEHATRPDGKFDVITCFETVEHVPDPVATFAKMAECAAEPGVIIYSTVTQPDDFDKQGMSWWYVGPRNGHISLFTKQALTAAWTRLGYNHISLNHGTHIAFRTLPEGWHLG
jgi:SAM-dependent methyltransferase